MQRAVACSLLAEGESVLRSPSYCADSLVALSIAEALGARVERRADSVRIEGAPEAILSRAGGELELSCGESGLCMRMFAPIVALRPARTSLLAAGSLARRSVGMVAAPLEALGARCATQGGLPPVRVEGPLGGGRAVVDASGSSQFLTGLLVALPLAPADSLLGVRNLASGGYVDLTVATMRAFGVEVGRGPAGAGEIAFDIEGRRRYRSADFAIEGDWSGAAFLLVAGAIAGSVVVEGLDTGSAQPDRAILEALAAAGARVEAADGRVAVERSELRGFSFDARNRPDLFPPLVALASRCEGLSLIRGAERLRGKESDRATALKEEFGKLGIWVEVTNDVMAVRGGSISGGVVDSRGDHRIAMAAAVAAVAADGPATIEDAECVAKSWPSFFEDLDSIRA
jgi:3-phosphoshikimate 1-carboxyvinyltransferase